MQKIVFPLIVILLFLTFNGAAKTRWSSCHLTPDADFLSGGQYVLDGHGYFFSDSAKGAVISPTVLADIGIIEWVNMEIGYAGGLTLGFKARLLNENQGLVPSLAIGARNIFKNKEAYYFHSKDTTLGNQFYIALSKSIDALRMRLHAGMLTIPTSKDDQVDPFVTLEEYFGAGLYGSIEVEKVKKDFLPSLFLSYRLFKKHLEISAGAVALNKLLFDKNNKFSFSLTSTDSTAFVKPGIWFGIRYCGALSFGKNNLFMSVDDKVTQQHDAIELLRRQVDSLKTTLSENQVRMAKVDNSLLSLSDSVYSDKNRFRAALYDKLIALKTMYETEPFDPDQVRQLIRRITALKENAIPALKEFIVDKKQDRRVRLLSISLLGEMGGLGASDVLLDVLSQSEDPEIKIEILIALGKMKETRAVYVMEQLANDPTDVVAFTAQEVLMKLVREKGIRLSADLKMRRVVMPESSVMKEEKLPIQKSKSAAVEKSTDSLSHKSVEGQGAESAKSEKKTTTTDSSAVPQTSAPPDSTKHAIAQTGKANDDVWGIQTPSSADSAGTRTAKRNAGAKAPSDSSAQPGGGQAKIAPDAKNSAAAPQKEKAAKKAKTQKKKSELVDDKNW